MKTSNKFHVTSGFSLVEIVVFLIIAAAIIFALVKLSRDKTDDSKVNAEAGSLALMISKTQKAKLLGAKLISLAEYNSLQLLPPHWKVTGTTTILNGFAGNSTLVLAGANIPANYHALTYDNLPTAKICIALGVSISRINSVGIMFAGTGAQVKSQTGALNYSALSSSCNTARNLSFHYSLSAI